MRRKTNAKKLLSVLMTASMVMTTIGTMGYSVVSADESVQAVDLDTEVTTTDGSETGTEGSGEVVYSYVNQEDFTDVQINYADKYMVTGADFKETPNNAMYLKGEEGFKVYDEYSGRNGVLYVCGHSLSAENISYEFDPISSGKAKISIKYMYEKVPFSGADGETPFFSILDGSTGAYAIRNCAAQYTSASVPVNGLYVWNGASEYIKYKGSGADSSWQTITYDIDMDQNKFSLDINGTVYENLSFYGDVSELSKIYFGGSRAQWGSNYYIDEITVMAENADEYESFTVSFYDEDETTLLGSKSVKAGRRIMPIDDPVKSGSTFLGWYLADATEADLSSVTSDMAVYAKFSSNCTVNYYDEDKETLLASVEVDYNGASEIAPPTKNGYTFMGWVDNEGALVDLSNITTNLDVYAWFEENCTIRYYDVDASGSATLFDAQTVDYASDVTPISGPSTRENMEFICWVGADGAIADLSNINADKELYAAYGIKDVDAMEDFSTFADRVNNIDGIEVLSTSGCKAGTFSGAQGTTGFVNESIFAQRANNWKMISIDGNMALGMNYSGSFNHDDYKACISEDPNSSIVHIGYDFNISAWRNAQSVSANAGGFGSVYGFKDNSATSVEIIKVTASTKENRGLAVYNSADSSWVSILPYEAGAMDTQAWHHIDYLIDKDNQFAVIMLDGKAKAKVPLLGNGRATSIDNIRFSLLHGGHIGQTSTFAIDNVEAQSYIRNNSGGGSTQYSATYTEDFENFIINRDTNTVTTNSSSPFTQIDLGAIIPETTTVIEPGVFNNNASKVLLVDTDVANGKAVFKFPEVTAGTVKVSYKIAVSEFMKDDATNGLFRGIGSLYNTATSKYAVRTSSVQYTNSGVINSHIVYDGTAINKIANSYNSNWHNVTYYADMDNNCYVYYFDGYKYGPYSFNDETSIDSVFFAANRVDWLGKYYLDDLTVEILDTPRTVVLKDGNINLGVVDLSAGTDMNPPTPPVKPGKVFAGWYADTTYTTPFVFASSNNAMAAYAKYVNVEMIENFENVTVNTANKRIEGSPFEITIGNGVSCIGDNEIYTVDKKGLNGKNSKVLFVDQDSEIKGALTFGFPEVTSGKIKVSYDLNIAEWVKRDSATRTTMYGGVISGDAVNRTVAVNVSGAGYSESGYKNSLFTYDNNKNEVNLISNNGNIQNSWKHLEYYIDMDTKTFTIVFDGTTYGPYNFINDVESVNGLYFDANRSMWEGKYYIDNLKIDTAYTDPIEQPSGDMSVEFSYTLEEDARTSAGVYDLNNNLIRTLWSAVEQTAGSHTASWDGLDDNGALMADGNYKVVVMSNNVNYENYVLVGNTSNIDKMSTIMSEYRPISDMSVYNDRMYYSNQYMENSRTWNYFMLNDSTKMAGYLESRANKISIRNCTDGNYVYWLESEWTPENSIDPDAENYNEKNFQNARVFIAGLNPETNTEVIFPEGKAVNNFWGAAIGHKSALAIRYTNAADVQTAYGDITVQKNGNYIIVVYGYDNYVRTVNKTTGAVSANTTINEPNSLAIDNADNVWISYKNADNTPALGLFRVETDGRLTLVKNAPSSVCLDTIIALAVSPNGEDIVMVYGGNTAKVASYKIDSWTQNWIYGRGESYKTNPKVYDDKFMFYSLNETGALTNKTIEYSFLTFENNNTLWLGDPGNERCLKLDLSTGQPVVADRISHPTVSYNCAVDVNNPSRIFHGSKEYYFDYTEADPSTAWRLENNWVEKVMGLASNTGSYIDGIATLSDGKTYCAATTYATGKYNIYEITDTSFVNTGIDITGYWVLNDGNMTLEKVADYTKDGVAGKAVYQRELMGFDSNGKPYWGTDVLKAFVPNSSGFSLTDKPAITSNGMLADVNTSNTHSKTNLRDMKMAGIKAVADSDNSWMWKACPATSDNYNGNFPSDGALEVNAWYTWHNVYAYGRNLIAQYRGEGYRQGQANKFYHLLDNGLVIGVFGGAMFQQSDAANYNEELVNGNGFNWVMVKSPVNPQDEAFIFQGGEAHLSGVFCQKITGLSTITENTIPITWNSGHNYGLNVSYYKAEGMSSVEKTDEYISDSSYVYEGFDRDEAKIIITGYIEKPEDAPELMKLRYVTDGYAEVYIQNQLIASGTGTINKRISFDDNRKYNIRIVITPNDGVYSLFRLCYENTLGEEVNYPINKLRTEPLTAVGAVTERNLLGKLPYDYSLGENDQYGWDLGNWFKTYSNSAKTNVKNYRSYGDYDLELYANIGRTPNVHDIAYADRNLGEVREDMTSWEIDADTIMLGQLNGYYTSNNAAWSGTRGRYIDVLDSNDKVIARVYPGNDYALYGNDQKVYQASVPVGYTGINSKYNHEFSIHSTIKITAENGQVTISYRGGSVTANVYESDADWSKPAKLRVTVFENCYYSPHGEVYNTNFKKLRYIQYSE